MSTLPRTRFKSNTADANSKKHRSLRRINVQVLIRRLARHTSGGRTVKKAQAHKIWFVHFLDGSLVFVERRRKRVQSHRAAMKFFYNRM